jgi:hypothetical protein
MSITAHVRSLKLGHSIGGTEQVLHFIQGQEPDRAPRTAVFLSLEYGLKSTFLISIGYRKIIIEVFIPVA